MSQQQLLTLLALIGALVIIWFRRMQKKPGSKSGLQQHSPPDVEASRLRNWSELSDEICAQVFPDEDPAELKALFARYGFKFSRLHEFAHEPAAEVVDDVIRSVFPNNSVSEVRAVLIKYKNTGPIVPDSRIHLDIVKASHGRFEDLAGLVKQASRDFRDVVRVAESPQYVEALFNRNASPPESHNARVRAAFIAMYRTLSNGSERFRAAHRPQASR